jgi:hypothetical protein
LQQFKARINATTIEVVRNPNATPNDDGTSSRKLFVDTPAGMFKCQQSFDKTKPIRFIYESEALFSDGCLCNVKPAGEIIASL